MIRILAGCLLVGFGTWAIGTSLHSWAVGLCQMPLVGFTGAIAISIGARMIDSLRRQTVREIRRRDMTP